MKKLKYFSFILIILTLLNCKEEHSELVTENKIAENSREYYQLKVYIFETEEQEKITDTYLEKAFLPGLKRLNINNIGVFKQRLTETDTIKKTYVLIPFSSIDQFLNLEDKLAKDENYLVAGNEYINASYSKPPYQRIASTLMKAFSDMPKMQPSKLDGSRAERVYELRSYQSATEQYYKTKVDMFNAGGEIKLFDRLQFNPVFYAEVVSGADMPNLMYMTTFSNQKSRDEHWAAFVDSPEWKNLKSMSKYENSVSKNEKNFLYPTKYSDY